MKKMDSYLKCPRCSKTLYIDPNYADGFEYEDDIYLGSIASCDECGWEGVILWEQPAYIGTIDKSEIR